jgi:quercetin dioxygenase-like cupin family protein
MGGKAHKDGRFRFVDLLIIILCLSGAAYAINLCRLDLFSTLDSRNLQPVGIIVIKNNIVQRRLEERILWDRLAVESSVYMGDLIRTAELSSATLLIEGISLDMDENTLIRIQRARDGSGTFEIELSEGVLGISAGNEGGNVKLNLMGRQVEVAPGTVLNAAVGSSGIVVQVSEGAALFIDEEQSREVSSGTILTIDAEGSERTDPAAVVINPQPNARYLKNRAEPLNIAFAWNRINLEPEQKLRMEIAGDSNFNNVTQVIENLDVAANAVLDSGPWYWRLYYNDNILSTGRFSITEAAGPNLVSPVTDSLFLYQDDNPQLRFQWSEIEGASDYIVEVSETPDFFSSTLRIRTTALFSIESSLGPGTWYWRVLPVFSSVYEGSAAFSQVSFFHIDQDRAQEPILILPESVIALPEPEPEQKSEPEQKLELSVPVELSLLSPAPGASLAGLTALRQQTEFRWNSDGEVASSRFIISRNPNPLTQPLRVITNPGQTIRLDRLEEGIYYWTVEARNPDGLISVAVPRQLRVLAIPLLAAPGNLRPSAGYYIGIEQLRIQRSIVFSWAAVQGANAYIFTLYEQTASGRRQIISRPAENRYTWTLDDIGTLEPGTFIWQVEAVNRSATGVIEQRGRIGENTFILDVPMPGPVQLEDPGVLYGN